MDRTHKKISEKSAIATYERYGMAADKKEYEMLYERKSMSHRQRQNSQKIVG